MYARKTPAIPPTVAAMWPAQKAQHDKVELHMRFTRKTYLTVAAIQPYGHKKRTNLKEMLPNCSRFVRNWSVSGPHGWVLGAAVEPSSILAPSSGSVLAPSSKARSP